VDTGLVEGLWAQFERAEVADNPLLDAPDPAAEVPMPPLPSFVARDNTRADYGTKHLCTGFSLECTLTLDALTPHDVLLDSRTPQGQGLALVATPTGALELVLNDGRTECRWASDAGLLTPGQHHVVATVDAGPNIITFVVDGVLCDGGTQRQFGWGRFSPNLQSANGEKVLRVAPQWSGTVHRVRIYGRALTTTEAIGNCRAES
jgi:hypothetical protein